MSLAPGACRGPYEILNPIGAGGMGEVYKARDTRLDRNVAIKVSKEAFSERFEREARAAARLSSHPHVITIFDVGETRGPEPQPLIVMEYMAGGTVADATRTGEVDHGFLLV